MIGRKKGQEYFFLRVLFPCEKCYVETACKPSNLNLVKSFRNFLSKIRANMVMSIDVEYTWILCYGKNFRRFRLLDRLSFIGQFEVGREEME